MSARGEADADSHSDTGRDLSLRPRSHGREAVGLFRGYESVATTGTYRIYDDI